MTFLSNYSIGAARSESLPWSVVALDPGAVLRCFGAARGRLAQDRRGKGCRFAGGQNGGQGRIQLWRGWLAEHGDMVNAVELEAIHRYVDGASGGIDRFLGLEVRHTGGSFAGEAHRPVIGDGFLFA